MDLMDFQAWVDSQVEIKPHFVKEGVWNFPCVLFGMPHTIRGYVKGKSGVFYLDFNVLEPSEEEIYTSEKILSKCDGNVSKALKMRVVEFFVSSVDYERKRFLLSEYNRGFGGGVSLFMSVQGKNPKSMSVTEILQRFEEMDSQKEIKQKREKIINRTIKEIKESIEKHSKSLLVKIEKELGELNE